MAQQERTVVITGASSGIGRATALAFANQGAQVVLAARNVEALSTLAAEVEDLGGKALVVPTDVSRYEHVQALGTATEEAFGPPDVWVNNAGVSSYGVVADTDVQEIERVIQVNLLGQVYGMKVALEHMRSRGTGVIVNVASALGRRSVPLQAAYCASKAGVLGFSESFRLELKDSDPGIHVVDVLPSSINTPLFSHARTKLGVMPRPIPPVYEPKLVADAICEAADHPARTVFVGGAAKALEVAQRVNPWLVDWYLRGPGQSVSKQVTTRPANAHDDNLEEPSSGKGTTTGDFGDESRPDSRYTHLVGVHPGRAPMAVLGALTGVMAVSRRRHRRH